MSKYTTYGKLDSLKFVVKNVSPSQKAIKVFGLKIPFDTSRDLMAIPEITEADIKASLAKGELANKIRRGALKIVENTLNLIEVDPGQRSFVESAGLVPGSIEGVDPETVIVGGGGGTVIEDGGTLSGEYDTDILCKGSATMVGNVTVNGDLTVLGTLYNDGGWELIVKKSMYTNVVNFTKADTSTSQSDLRVEGNLYFREMYYGQCGGLSALLRVGGDLVGTNGYSGSPLDGNGNDDTSGLNILVYGDMTVSNLYLSGGNSVLGNAGNGGIVTVYGDMQVALEIYMDGGNAYFTGFDAGNGGTLEVYGNFTMGDYSWTVDFGGGSADNGNAGNGGFIEIHGNAVLTNGDGDFNGYGGNCSSDNENHRAGNGCSIEVYGDLFCDTDLELGGGDRYGSLSTFSFVAQPNGGNIFVKGNARIDEIDVRGGDIYTVNFVPCASGNGGDVTIYGNLTLSEELITRSGSSNIGPTGNGGNVTIHGNLACSQYISLYAPSASNGDAGYGGNLYVRGNAVVRDYIEAFGGDADNGFAGSGGNIGVDGFLICDYIDLSGGNCNSPVETHHAGAGGSINAFGLNSNFSISVSAGDRLGATTVSNIFNYTPNAGFITINGDLSCDSIYGTGSLTFTNYPNAAGGQGSNLEVYGNLTVGLIDFGGGNSVGNSGGRGGNILVTGFTKVNDLYCQGGGSFNSSGVGLDAGTNGAGPNEVELQGGIICQNLDLTDGSGDVGSLAPANGVYLYLAGSCAISNLIMTNRAAVQCMPVNNNQVILKLGSMTGKTSLNNNLGNESTDISAFVADSLYISNGSSWYALAGTTIFI